MKPLVFTGKAKQLSKSINYDLRANGVRFCQDFIEQYEDLLYAKSDYTYEPDIPAWGYYGNGPRRTAMALLSLSLAHKGIGPSVDNNVDWDDHPDGIESSADFYRIQIITEKYYEAFAKRIIAKLPPQWTMTSTEVKRWIKRQELKRKREKQTTKSTKAKPKARSKR